MKFPQFILVINEKNEIVGQLGLTITKERRAYSTQFLKQVLKIASKLGNRGSWVSGPIIFSDKKKERLEILDLIIKSARVSISRDLLISQFWQNLQAKLQPAVPKDKTGVPGKK